MEILFSRHYFLQKRVYLAFFSLQLADTTNNFELILAARKEEYKSGLSNVIYFRHLEILHCGSVFGFYVFSQPLDNLFLII